MVTIGTAGVDLQRLEAVPAIPDIGVPIWSGNDRENPRSLDNMRGYPEHRIDMYGF